MQPATPMAKNGSSRGSKGNDGAWAKTTVGGPAAPPDIASAKKGKRSGAPLADEVLAGAQLAAKHVMTGELAAAVPHNPIKASEYGEDGARDPETGTPVDAGDPSVGGSTLTEGLSSAKLGSGRPAPGENPTNGPLDRVRADATGQALTTNQGVRVGQNQDSLKAGIRGPSLLQDFILREKLTTFDHERIPERVVHARGSAAHGYFECHTPLTKFSKAAPFAKAGKQTPVFVRFSTVAGERGSVDTARDVRGFAVKFYTEDGNWDLVGNNMPVFFIQDAMKFPDLIHAVKPEPHHGMPQAASAHDTFWDFVSLMPESTHMLMWAMSDRAIPRSYRTMQGFGVHTFRLVNDDGASVLCKFHWNPAAGTHSLVWDEAVKIAGADADFHRRDLWEAIEAGAYPEWELAVQVFTEEQADRFSFDVLDPTKIVPEELVPLTPVGRLVLNRNPDNFFAETEQVAFCTAHVIPGIDFTNDPLLQGRIHSYIDTQLTRLGGPNFHEIPINAPVAQIHNNQRDGMHRQTLNRGRVSYEPNSLGGGCPFQAGSTGFVPFPQPVEGDMLRGKPELFADHYTQATLFYRSQTPAEQRHIAAAFTFELTRVQTPAIRQRVVATLANVDAGLAAQVADGLGFPVPPPLPRVIEKPKKPEVDRSPALSLTSRPGDAGVRTRRVAILVADGVGGAEAIRDLLAHDGAVPRFLGAKLGTIDAAEGPLQVDVTLSAMPAVLFDGLVVPDGVASTLATNGHALEFLKDTYRHCKPILAPGDGTRLLEAAGIPATLPSGKPDPALFTGDADPTDFADALARHRDFGRESDPPRV